MEVVVCQTCDEVITYMEGDKTGVLYGQCPGCDKARCSEDN